MNTKQILIMAVSLIAISSSAAVEHFSKSYNAIHELNSNIEALTDMEGCLMRPNGNTGRCRESVQEGIYHCVDSYWFERNNCISD